MRGRKDVDGAESGAAGATHAARPPPLRDRHHRLEPIRTKAIVTVSGSGIAEGAGDVPSVGVTVAGAVEDGVEIVVAETDDVGVAGVDVGGTICSGARVTPGFVTGVIPVGVNIDSKVRPIRGW